LRETFSEKRTRLIVHDMPTSELEDVLKTIFAMYIAGDDDDGVHGISYAMACRLWYRCGMKLSSLDSLLEKEKRSQGEVEFTDFLKVVCRVIEADTPKSNDALGDEARLNCEVRPCGFQALFTYNIVDSPIRLQSMIGWRHGRTCGWVRKIRRRRRGTASTRR
jgi:hypothetical protein